jgi:poly-gamma-glutamate synthesis protein (capsule biosynthesis protein)
MDEFDGDDDASTAANNTSALNVRTVGVPARSRCTPSARRSTSTRCRTPTSSVIPTAARIDPPHAGAYVSRRERRACRAGHRPVRRARFVEWGGRWRGTIDYQHFQVGRGLAYRLAGLSAADAALFARHVQRAAPALRR